MQRINTKLLEQAEGSRMKHSCVTHFNYNLIRSFLKTSNSTADFYSYFKSLILIIFILIAFSPLATNAQTVENADELFKAARTAAFEEKNNSKAIQLSKQALTLAPTYVDVEIFLARLYSWNKQYDSAKYSFDHILSYAPNNVEAYSAYTDLEYWNHHYDKGIVVVNKGLAIAPSSEDLLIRKARILQAQKKYAEALTVTNLLLKINRKSTEAIALASNLRNLSTANKIAFTYDYIKFDKQFDQPWHLANLGYTRQTAIGPVTANVNYANRFGRSGFQGEVEAYPHFNKTFYSYVSFGYSPDEGVFPKYRAGASLYVNLPKSFETEGGVRYLNFGSSTYIYTLYIGKYIHNILLGARAFVTPGTNGNAETCIANARYFLRGADDYFGLSLGTGISPDDSALNVQYNDVNRLKSQQATLNFSHSIKSLNIITLKAAWFNQEFKTGTKGNQVDIGIGFQRRF